jgi:hypothetical protein
MICTTRGKYIYENKSIKFNLNRPSFLNVMVKTFLVCFLMPHSVHTFSREKSWCDCDEASNYMHLTFDNFTGYPYQLSGLNSDYAGRLGWVTELANL